MDNQAEGGQELKPLLEDRVVSLPDWWKVERSSPGAPNPLPLMDLRSSKEYAMHRLFCGNSKLEVVPFPIEFLKERSFELPARHVEFSILLSPSDLQRAQEFLLGPKPNARNRPLKPWRVSYILLDTPDLWHQARNLGICQESALPIAKEEKIFPLPRIWQPDAMVQNMLLPLLKELPAQVGDIWDLASGSGRDVAFLAEELIAAKKAFQVVGLDHRYNSKETDIVTGFWDRRGLANQTQCIQMDLSKWPEKSIPATTNLAALYAVRFWKPDLVEALAESTTLATGTIFGLSHFCKPFEGAPWDFKHPSEKTVLERNQLHRLFQDQWHILHDEIALDSDHGRTMIHFVARRK